MSISATFVEAWQLVVNDVKLRTVKHIEHDTDAKKVMGWLEQADHGIVTQKRRFYGLSGHDPDTGSESSGFTWYVGGGITIGFKHVGRVDSTAKYVCTSDRLEIVDEITGTGWNIQTWELQSKFKPVEGSYFEETVPEGGGGGS